MNLNLRSSFIDSFFFLVFCSLLSCGENVQKSDDEPNGPETDTVARKMGTAGNGNNQTASVKNVLSTVYMTGRQFKELQMSTGKLSFQFFLPEAGAELSLAGYRLHGNNYDKPPQYCTVLSDKWPLTLEPGRKYILGGQSLKMPDIKKIVDSLDALPGTDDNIKIVSFRPLETLVDDHVQYGINVFENLAKLKAEPLVVPLTISKLNPSPPAGD